MKVIATPGHTPGHMCLYIERYKLLIAGDLFLVKDGNITTCPKELNYNNDMYFVIPYTLPLDETYQYTDFHVGLIENWHTAWQRCRSDLALLKYGFITEDALTFDPNTGEWRDTSQ